ncbi:Protein BRASSINAZOLE-RESISTANT 1 [Zea mays]|uniref:Protein BRASSINAZOLE-RESISTANT 1 n=1 Tax=Zea mays TaxID=4577 RepID=A0A1D6MHD8_MAIZE|nr:Protein BRASSINAZOLE-RESISTANT 1 [Zea mays]
MAQDILQRHSIKETPAPPTAADPRRLNQRSGNPSSKLAVCPDAPDEDGLGRSGRPASMARCKQSKLPDLQPRLHQPVRRLQGVHPGRRRRLVDEDVHAGAERRLLPRDPGHATALGRPHDGCGLGRVRVREQHQRRAAGRRAGEGLGGRADPRGLWVRRPGADPEALGQASGC